MAITPHIEAEAQRTIEEIQDYYRRFSDDVNDSDEMEHRIQRVERLKEACNGLSDTDKLQKTAENLFEVGTAWERGTDMLKKIIRKNQSHVEKQLTEIRKENNENYLKIQDSINDLSNNMNKKFEEEKQYNETHFESKVEENKKEESISIKANIIKFIDNHFVGCLIGIITIIVFIFVSGHIDLLSRIIDKF